MRSRFVLPCAGLAGFAGVLAACSTHDAPDPARTSSAVSASVIAPDRTAVVVYANPGEDEGLPASVPVIVSYTNAHPSVAFRIACGSNYGRMLEGFGYPRDLNLDSVDHYASLDTLREALRPQTPDAPEVPLHTLSCAGDEAAVRDQVLRIYRTVDADATKGQANYYVRLRDDPGAVYTLGCWNFVKALGWDQPEPEPPGLPGAEEAPASSERGWAEAVTIPINHAVLATWAQQGVVQREINCYDARGTALPPVDRTLPVSRPTTPPSDRAALYRVRRSFDGISAPMPLYLISNGKGYALDCGSNQESIKAALGIPRDATIPELAANDPILLGSHPGEQPNLRCSNAGATIFEATDEQPATKYFHFGSTNTLFQFTCDTTRDFFAQGLTDVRGVPGASIAHLFPDTNAPEATTRVLRVGCAAHDECEAREATCAPGTYCVDQFIGSTCASCPPGYTSDGYTCRDSDECASASATCSADTYCVNDVGSYHCAACATGMAHERLSEMADVNGDGRMDFVGFGAQGVVVALAMGDRFGDPRIWTASYGDAGGWNVNSHPRMLADVNADGRADVVGFANAGVYVALSTGKGFAAPSTWVSAYGQNADSGSWKTTLHPRFMADVNGDGRADVVGFGDPGVYVSLSTGTAFSAPKLWLDGYFGTSQGWKIAQHPRFMADMNGDEKADIVGFADDGVHVALSTGTGFKAQTRWLNAFGRTAGGWDVAKHPRLLADVNGDGKDDVVAFSDSGAQVALSTGTGLGASKQWLADFGYNAGGWRTDQHVRVLADVDGDRRADVVGFGIHGVHIATSTGSAFRTASRWSDDFGYANGWRVAGNARYAVDLNGDHRADLVGLANNGVLQVLSTGTGVTSRAMSVVDYQYDACR